MRLHLLLPVLLLCLCISLNAQFVDNTWVLGYGGGFEEQDSFGLTTLTFYNNQLSIGPETEIPTRMRINNSSISNGEGAVIVKNELLLVKRISL